MTVVYRLVDPLTFDVLYIGQTLQDLDIRLKGHCKQPGNPEMKKWVSSLLELGLTPIIEPIEKGLPWKRANRREHFWIDFYRSQGHKLLNIRG